MYNDALQYIVFTVGVGIHKNPPSRTREGICVTARGTVRPGLPRTVMVYTGHSDYQQPPFTLRKCPDLGENYMVTLVKVSSPLEYKWGH